MNRRDHDMVVRAAFGESEPGERAFVDEMLRRDPEARAVFDEFASLQSGLRGMDDTPACRLSTERLRAAILDQGVRPRRVFPTQWVWGAGMAAAACLAVVMFVRPRPESPLASGPVASVTRESEPSASEALKAAPAVGEAPPVEAATTEPEHPADLGKVLEAGVPAVAPRPSNRARHKDKGAVSASASAPSKLSLKDKTSGETTAAASRAVGGGENPETDVTPPADTWDTAATSVPDGPVVVVQPQTDPRTGAAVAFESNHASDFVFGG